MTEHKNLPPDYILVSPVAHDVPDIIASCNKDSIDDMKDLKLDGMYIYKRIGRY